MLGGDTVHLGDEPDLAALYEMAVGAMLLPALVGFFQGAAALQARGLPADSMVRFAGKWLDMIKGLLPVYAAEIDSGDYNDAASSVNLFLAGAAHDDDRGAQHLGTDRAAQEGGVEGGRPPRNRGGGSGAAVRTGTSPPRGVWGGRLSDR
ncbi:hypothetical protein GCM10010383_60840 [Streptomyces lomondensis]|uniref:NADPH-dependent reductive aminase-like C-terminal domain-containing protein n=1 Tax=Streptomyces lomondensis TaxID=68229 RepID=A0ABQ2XLW1_9ACTN|nr:hypothetical protein GCM10010383_60840 [Streptomyces lomondensis]